MADPVSISASCGVLLHKILMKIGLNAAIDDVFSPQGSSPSSDPSIRKNVVEDSPVTYGLIVHIYSSRCPSYQSI